MSFSEINDLLETEKARFVILLCHHNADPDAICSAYAFSILLKQFRPNIEVEIGAAHGMSRLSKHLLQHLPIEVEAKPAVEKAHAIVLLDTNTIQQLDSLSERVMNSKAPIIVIDHHASHPKTEQLARISITQEESSSTCEIIYDFFRQAGVKPGADEAKALFLGIAFDTRHFILANSNTLKNVAELVDAGISAIAGRGLPSFIRSRNS
jgi:phosphoesterase RecJ-like protein